MVPVSLNKITSYAMIDEIGISFFVFLHFLDNSPMPLNKVKLINYSVHINCAI